MVINYFLKSLFRPTITNDTDGDEDCDGDSDDGCEQYENNGDYEDTEENEYAFFCAGDQ